jgi:isocitrate/isopropylmalate dehydrogenase
MSTYSIAVIAGDGIGREVMPAAVHALQAASAKFGFTVRFQHFDWSCESESVLGRVDGPRPPDLGGTADTETLGRAIAAAV